MRHGIRRNHLKRSTGQALILVMLTLPLLFSVCAVVVDGTNLMVNRRQMQNAADASALAAGQELLPAIAALEACPPGDTACRTAVQENPALYTNVANTAEEYSGKNGGPSTLTRCQSAGGRTAGRGRTRRASTASPTPATATLRTTTSR